MLTQNLGKTFVFIILNREVQLQVPRKESYPIPLRYIDLVNLCGSGDCTRKGKFMIIGMSSRTEIYQSYGLDFTRFMLLNERLLKGFDKPGERLMKIQTTSRPDHVWPETFTRIWESEHAYGKPLINNNTSRSV